MFFAGYRSYEIRGLSIMEMTFRWFGSKFDTVSLEYIRQIPGVKGIITTLYDTTPGEAWDR